MLEPNLVVQQVLQYAGKSMTDIPRPRNPCLTARETIIIADYITALVRERDEARESLGAHQIGVKHLHEELDTLTEERDALRAEVELLRGTP